MKLGTLERNILELLEDKGHNNTLSITDILYHTKIDYYSLAIILDNLSDANYITANHGVHLIKTLDDNLGAQIDTPITTILTQENTTPAFIHK